MLHMIFPGTLDHTRLLFRRQETLHFVHYDHCPAVGARASIQGLCCNSEDKFFPKICAKTDLTNPEHTGKYVMNDMKCTSTNCTHICGKSPQKRQYVWWCMTNFHKFGQLIFTTAPQNTKIGPFFLRLWTGEVDHCKLGPGKVHEIIGLPAAMMVVHFWWDGSPSPVEDPCASSSDDGYPPRCIFGFSLEVPWRHTEDSWEMSKFQNKYINYVTPILWGGEQLYKIYITWSNPQTIPDLGLTPRCIFHMGPQKPDGRSTAEKRGQMGLLSC